MIIFMMKRTEKGVQLCKVKNNRAITAFSEAIKILQARGFVEIDKDEWNRQLEAKRALLAWEAQS